MASGRSTRQRAVIKAALTACGRFTSAQELHDMLQADGQEVGLTTVYRALSALTASGEVDALQTASGEAIYRLCETREHHHHVVCTNCGDAVEVKAEPVERWAAEVARGAGYTPVTHTAEVYGVCGPCGSG